MRSSFSLSVPQYSAVPFCCIDVWFFLCDMLFTEINAAAAYSVSLSDFLLRSSAYIVVHIELGPVVIVLFRYSI